MDLCNSLHRVEVSSCKAEADEKGQRVFFQTFNYFQLLRQSKI